MRRASGGGTPTEIHEAGVAQHPEGTAGGGHPKPAGKKRWLRWVLAGAALVVVAIVPAGVSESGSPALSSASILHRWSSADTRRASRLPVRR